MTKNFLIRALRLGLLTAVACVHAASTLPKGVSDIVRQLQEWRDISSAWLTEATVAHKADPASLRQLKADYVEASAIANSLIAQFELDIVARNVMDPKRYSPHVVRAKTACESLAREAKRLLLESDSAPAKNRGPAGTATAAAGADAKSATQTAASSTSSTNGKSTSAVTDAERGVVLLGSILDIVTKNRRAFLELDEKQRNDVAALLRQARWTTLDAPAATAAPAAKK